MKKDRAYDHVYKYCRVCGEKTDQIVETTQTSCTKCGEYIIDDADELFGPRFSTD